MSTLRSLLRALVVMSAPFSFAAAQEPTASVHGTVTDSIRHGPLVGATIIATPTVSGAPGASHVYSATSDTRGNFSLVSLPPGMYVLTVEHPWLDSTGLGVPARQVNLVHQPAATVTLAVPSGATIRAAFCRLAARDSSIGLVAGYVKDAHSDHPVVGARVVFAWIDFDVDRRTAQATPRERSAAASTGRDGTFRMCGLPLLRPMLMQAQLGEHEATGALEVQVPASGVLVETLRLDAGTVGTSSVIGDVRREGSQRAVAGAHVHVLGSTADVVTGQDGSFQLSKVPVGTQSVEVTALGFNPRRYALDVRSDDTSKVTLSLSEAARVLDSVKILGKRAGVLTPYGEFDERSAHGAGQYITEEMIAKAHALETAELMQQARGFYVMSDTVYSSRGLTSMNVRGQARDRVCQPTLYIDGHRAAGTMNDILPSVIYGIEIYASAINVPRQYPAALCGAILIWTKLQPGG